MTTEQKLEIAIQALRYVTNPIKKFKDELQEGEMLDGMWCVRLADSPQTYKGIAQKALDKIEYGEEDNVS